MSAADPPPVPFTLAVNGATRAASLNALAVSTILHVAVGRRRPLNR